MNTNCNFENKYRTIQFKQDKLFTFKQKNNILRYLIFIYYLIYCKKRDLKL